jgi:hypothetical protein
MRHRGLVFTRLAQRMLVVGAVPRQGGYPQGCGAERWLLDADGTGQTPADGPTGYRDGPACAYRDGGHA